MALTSKTIHLCILGFLFAHSPALLSQESKIQFKIFNGETVTPILNNGTPSLVENAFIKIDKPKIIYSPSKLMIDWIFGLTNKCDRKIKKIRIEESYTDKPNCIKLKDTDPKFIRHQWSGQTAQTDDSPISKTMIPWLYENNDSYFLFRFTVEFEVGEPSVLTQLFILTCDFKAAILSHLNEVIDPNFKQLRVRFKPPEPPYPEFAKIARIQGIVVVEVTVGPNGEVSQAKAIEGPLPLRKYAEDYCLKWRFYPAIFNGTPQTARFRLLVPFTLR